MTTTIPAHIAPTTAPVADLPDDADIEQPDHRTRHRLRRTALLVSLLGGLLVVSAAGGLLSAWAALVEARAQASEGQAALLDGDLERAAQRFAAAQETFIRADEVLAGPRSIGLRITPFVASNTAAVQHLAEAGALVAGAGERIARAGVGGDLLSVLSPTDGALPVNAMRELALPAAELGADISQAHTLAAGVDTSWLVGPVVEARAELLGRIGAILPAARNASHLAAVLPAFLGADEPRSYFVGAASPAELRGAGGLIGAYAIMEADDGAMRFGDFLPVQGIGDLGVGEVPVSDPSLAARYDRYGGTGFWLNINMTPDFPSAATHIEQLYARTAGSPVDGTIVATPSALAAMMQVTGDVEVAGYGTIRADEAVEVLGNDAYGDDIDNIERKRILGAAAKEVFSRFLGGDGEPVQTTAVLAGVVARGELLLHSAHSAEQVAFHAAGIDGGLTTEATDMLAVVGNNAAGSKVDFYGERATSYHVELAPGGELRGTATVRLHNDAPAVGPHYVLGPYPGTGLEAGENATILSTYCGTSCRLRSFARDGADEPISAELELGHPAYTSWVQLKRGERTELTYAWDTAAGWSGDADRGSYRLTFLDQATIRPSTLALTVALPEGVEVTSASSGVLVADDGTVSWTGEPSARQRIEVEWRRPPSDLLRTRVRDLLNRPLLG